MVTACATAALQSPGISKRSGKKYLNYIYKHDLWRSTQIDEYRKLPKQTKKQRRHYKKEKEKADRHAVLRVLNLIERMQREEMQIAE